jgi:UDPglucose--hexose-1-phosphate uridylyltransferase
MKRTVTRLSDGRQLIYFDEREPDGVRPEDRRDLAPLRSASELRYDPVVDEWVTIAAHRQDRTHLPPDHECPLCPSTPDRHTEIPAYDYDVVVFENRFPVLSHLDTVSTVDLPVPVRPGVGRCEVVCYTADHETSFADLTPERVRTVVDVWADRTAELSELPGVEQVLCFENRGEEIGVTLRHPHGQVYALPFVAPRTARMLAAARRRGATFLADLLAAERASGVRVVAANEHWTAFVPAAARWPFEVHVYPTRRVPDIPLLDDAERDSFGPLYLDLLRRLDTLFGVPMPYVAAWHQAPVRLDRELAHLYLQLFSIRRTASKLKYVAATESAMGVFSNDVLPEEAARLLREVRPDASR